MRAKGIQVLCGKANACHAWMRMICLAGILIFCSQIALSAQRSKRSVPYRDSFNKKKFWSLAALGSGIYGAATIGLNAAWYQETGRSSFHFFNDWGEWRKMDKLGHSYTAYFEAELCFKGARWAKMPNKGATWTGVAAAFVMQTTVEMRDAYSTRWGFSPWDMGFNLAGIGIFAFQQLHWKEQRMRLKLSSSLDSYPTTAIRSANGLVDSRLVDRSNELFGTAISERLLKDYNAQTVWLSVNPKSFFPTSRIPPWLNLAVGYSAENLYGGFSNTWTELGQFFKLSEDKYPRYSQWLLSPDIDLSRIPTRSKVLKTALTILNIFKIPAPAFEYSRAKLSWRWLYL